MPETLRIHVEEEMTHLKPSAKFVNEQMSACVCVKCSTLIPVQATKTYIQPEEKK